MATATIGQWGNAAAIRLPKPFCETLNLNVGDDVRIVIEDNSCIVIESTYEKDTLQARMKAWDGKRYRWAEMDWGAPQGDELW